MKQNKSPQSEAYKYVKLWRSVFGENKFPIDVKLIALEVAKNQKDPIKDIRKLSEFGANDIKCEGALYYSESQNHWFIIYNDASKRSHNFTLAHEFGHYCLHREKYTKFECSSEDVNDKSIQDLKDIEREADTFASYLLMPIDDFRKQIDGQPISFDLFGKCVDRYQTSLISVILKWLEFTELYATFVASIDGFILWSFSSKPAIRRGIHFKKGTELPDNSFAKQKIDYRFLEKNLLPTDSWNYPYPVEEMSFYSDQYEQTFTLLIFKGVAADNYDIQEEIEEDTVDFFTRFDK